VVAAAWLGACGCAVEKGDAPDGGPDLEELDAQWDVMTPDERVEALEPGIEGQLRRYESGAEQPEPQEVSRLMVNLSALRAEMWGTPEGRRKYVDLQERIRRLR
jgi:hypothetical protein